MTFVFFTTKSFSVRTLSGAKHTIVRVQGVKPKHYLAAAHASIMVAYQLDLKLKQAKNELDRLRKSDGQNIGLRCSKSFQTNTRACEGGLRNAVFPTP